MINHHRASGISTFLIFLVALSAIGLVIERHQTVLLMSAYLSAFFCYVGIVRLERNFYLLLSLGILSRLMLFLDLPHLSDDVFRFLWDGELIARGINPFQYRPEELEEIMDPELFSLLNSQIHYTVYPPLNQGIFWLSAIIGNQDYLIGTNIIRAFLLAADLGVVFLLARLGRSIGKSDKIIWWYFLNPLVILEFVGNLHFEGLVVFFILLSLYALSKNKVYLGGLAMGLAAATKLIPLIFLPFIALKHRWIKGLLFSVIAVTVFLLSIYPLFDLTSVKAFTKSLMLYSNKFEFNASFYYLIREIGWWIKGYNPIETWGPSLSLFTFVMITAFSVFSGLKNQNTYSSMLWVLTIYLLLATTVHPWYVLTLIPLGLLCGYYWPVVWSLMAFVSYIGYEPQAYELSMVWIVVEYVVVFSFAAFEIAVKTKKIAYE